MADEVALAELDDLRMFIEDAFRRADPTLDTSPGSPLDREVITPLLTRLGPDPYDTAIEDFIRVRLVSEYPGLSVQEGEPIDDYMVKPNRVLLQPFRRVIQQVKQNQSIADPSVLSDEEADYLGENFFVRRKQGQYSSGIARLYYSAPQYSLVTPSNPVSTSGDLKFYPVENQAISADNMLFNTEGPLYYFDIVVRSESPGSEYSIGEGELVEIEGLPSVVRVINKAAFEDGLDREGTVEYLSRVENSLTERSLVTSPGILARLSGLFESLRVVQVIGYGDVEMARDILTGADDATTYAAFEGSVSSGTQDEIVLDSNKISDGDTDHDDFVKVEVAIGDTVERMDLDPSSPTYREVFTAKVVEVLSATRLKIDSASPFVGVTRTYMLKRSSGTLTLSDIPGGILEPTTAYGEVQIQSDQVHIGGMMDVFVRAGLPQSRSTNLESIRDADPLRFGVDLEAFGEVDDIFINITGPITGNAMVPDVDINGDSLATRDNILIRYENGGTNPWIPTEEDVGRYIQVLGYNGTLYGTFEVLEVLSEETISGLARWTRIRIDLFNHDDGTTLTNLDYIGLAWSLDFRLREKVSIKGLVRDRDNTRVPSGELKGAGIDFNGLGAEVGDSVVVETGDDAGVFTVRRLVTMIDDYDTLMLDRDLTKTATPSGSGDRSGLRYRINDELDVDLVEPRVTKIPLGTIFSGDDLYAVAGSDTVQAVGDGNFLLAGVVRDDILEIEEGDNKGRYTVLEVTGTTLRVDSQMLNTGSGIHYSVYTEFDGVDRPLVRVSEIELLDSSNQPTGVKVPYGDPVDIRALGNFSNLNEGATVESYSGNATEAAGEYTLEDVNFDFAAKGVLPGYRLTILNTSNVGDYTVKEVAALGASPSWVKVYNASEGGKDFVTHPTSSSYYRLGLPSSGYARFYFLEPTSMVVDTGIEGGRLRDELSREFRFTPYEGYFILPSPGAEDEGDPRDLRVVRTYQEWGAYYSVVEITDTDTPDAFDLEVQPGDLLEVFEELEPTDTTGASFGYLGIFGKTAGLQTVIGSNRVGVPENSSIDFTEMNSPDGLIGQRLFIDSGPDEGEYTIEEVIDAKNLRLSAVMTSTTQVPVSREYSAPSSRDSTLTDTGSGTAWLTDTSNTSALGTQVGYYITIFDATRPDIEGTFEILEIDLANNRIKIDLEVDASLGGTSYSFTWLRTSGDYNVMQDFHIYNATAKQLEVKEVGTKERDRDMDAWNGVYVGIGATSLYSGNLIQLTSTDVDFSANASKGDRLEILFGDNFGVYEIADVLGPSVIVVDTYKPFLVQESKVWFRIRGGAFGSRRMLTVGDYEGTSGLISAGDKLPYRIRRAGEYRISSTEMENNFDGTLYYADLVVESQGAGDDLNLEKDTRMVHTSGVAVDGYTYVVENESLTFSPYERASLKFERRFLPAGNTDLPENMSEVSGKNLKIQYGTSTIAGIINNILRAESERAVNANPIGRHLLPSYVYTSLLYSGGAPDSVVGKEVGDYINSLGRMDMLEVSDVEAIVSRRGATYIEHPINLVSVTHDLGRNLVVERSDNRIGGTVVPYNGTARISSYFAILGEGLNVERES